MKGRRAVSCSVCAGYAHARARAHRLERHEFGRCGRVFFGFHEGEGIRGILS
jgi:hypothetical protein